MARWKSVLLLSSPFLITFVAAWADDAKDEERLEGMWSFVKTSDGTAEKKEKRSAVRMVFQGNAVAFVSENKQRNVQGTYAVDPTKVPKTMDLVMDYGGKRATTLAIYELDGDMLKLCHYLGPKASQERPKEFVADKQTVVGILKREKE